MAAEVLVGAERRVLISGYGALPAPPPPDSLLGRLDQIDLRLRQLEDQRQPSSAGADDIDGGVSCFATDSDSRRGGPPRHQHSKSMPSALQQQQQAHVLRGSLMDRLNLLESRIRQLSCELDLDGGKAASLAPLPVEDRAWSEPPLPEPRGGDVPAASVRARAAAPAPAAGASWSAVQILQKGARQLHRNKPNHPAKVKKLKEAKCACEEEEKRKAERGNKQPSASRRWFAIGC